MRFLKKIDFLVRFMLIHRIIGLIVSLCIIFGNILSINFWKQDSKRDIDDREWIIVWKNKADPSIFRQVHLLHASTNLDDMQIQLVAVKKGVSVEQWIKQWKHHPAVAYLQPNEKFHLGERIFPIGSYVLDPYYHLRMIRIEQAWNIFKQKTDSRKLDEIVVAVVDTGVDLNNPLLAPFLLPGVNVKDRSQPPQDRMGHGTEVAGVIAGIWGAFHEKEKKIGKGKILPIKVMEDGEDGELYYTVEGIREAIRQKADIIVLAQGSWRYSAVLEKVIQEAEKKGILVIGAVGNASFDVEGELIYNRPLYYPAAFPTVMAVGSVRMDGTHEPTSNIGDGIDLVAPGESITTISLDQTIRMGSGTSFATPQVAGIAALIWQLNPEYTPKQIRHILIQSTIKDPKQPRWDEKYGFGLIDAVKAMQTTWKPDYNEPNNHYQHAMPISFYQEKEAQIDMGDEDWYVIRPRHSGKIRIKQFDIKEVEDHLVWTVWIPSENKQMTLQPTPSGEWILDVPDQEVFLRVSAKKANLFPINYRFIVYFELHPDKYENNDRLVEAKTFTLREGSLQIDATIHRPNDEDWYRLQIPSLGVVTVTVYPNSPRFDPVILWFPGENGRLKRVDQGGEGEPETLQIPVESFSTPLLIRIEDYGGNAIDEPYRLEMNFISKQELYSRDSSTVWKPGEIIDAQVEDDWDVDWYRIDLKQDMQWAWSLKSNGADTQWEWVLYDEHKRVVDRWSGFLKDNQKLIWDIPLKKGLYYLRIQGKTDGKPRHYQIEFLSNP